ncbi:uncharacterized protein LOC103508762 [Diaphorina citri]|uniref:Uncharacterized protein LOC103508762 n=1 Tax=Diaphorina citri TaxID=121845 RepID=A0A3Q0IS08_DIACI|nr:uncharacterized protein LOC103508762 [Diaphorina citri]KAI5699935.1 hypothetical protein M8J75_011343 [Diaphorina citri]KAI5731598.1 hypothetical protein M8J77_013120 [Diaphorina citri]
MESCKDLWELGPPPDFILSIPPPPLPENVQLSAANLSSTPCGLMCDVTMAQGAELIDLARHGRVVTDDTWVFVLFACGLLVLICSSMVALFFIKYKESRESKISLHEEHLNAGKACETVLYPPTANDKILWATLTPKGTTQHFTTANPSCVHKNSFENTAFDSDDYLVRRPKVSLPTRIENPNIPPLNLYPTLGKNQLNQQALL